MARKKSKPKFQSFEIPDSFLDQVYELSGASDKNKGYILCYIDENGSGQIKHKFDSQATEFAIMKFIEVYLNQYDSGHELRFSSQDFFDDTEDGD